MWKTENIAETGNIFYKTMIWTNVLYYLENKGLLIAFVAQIQTLKKILLHYLVFVHSQKEKLNQL